MNTYSEASQFKQMLKGIVDEMIENHPLVKSAIKVKKAVVWDSPNTQDKTIKVKFLPDIFNPDIEATELPYSPKMQSYLQTATLQQSTVSVWYYQSLSNGIVMQDGEWTI